MKRLLALMEEGGLTEVEYEHRGTRLRLARHPAPPPPQAPVVLAGGMLPAPAPAPAAATEAEESAEDPGTVLLLAPMVGTFYRAPSPEAAPFVQVGDQVRPDTTVCILEAMKVMNEIKAEHVGEVVAILAENGEAVEYGQPLFRIRVS